MTVLFEPHRREAQQFAVLLGSDVHVAATVVDLASLLRQYPTELLVVLGSGVPLETALAVAAEYRVSRPAMGVILVRERLDVGLLGEAIRAGVREVVASGDPAGLLAACARSLDVSRQMAPPYGRSSRLTDPVWTRCSRQPARRRPSGSRRAWSPTCCASRAGCSTSSWWTRRRSSPTT